MKRNSIGIDLGGTRIKIGIISDGVLLDQSVIGADSAQGLAANLPRIEAEINRLLEKNSVGLSTLHGIGLAFPGLVDPVSKKILSTNAKYDDAISIDLNDWIRSRWPVEFFIDNDARMAAVGEWKYGSGTDTDDMVVMTIGTGIGTAAIIGGQLLRGKHFQAGCLGGHISVQYNGRPCTCGNIGCAEAYGSSWSLTQQLAKHPDLNKSLLASASPLDFAALFAAAKQNDTLALQIRDEYLSVWSAAVVNMIHAYDPDVVVIGGGVLNSQEDIMPFIRGKVKQHAWCPWGDVQIRPSRLINDAGILGVAHCLNHFN